MPGYASSPSLFVCNWIDTEREDNGVGATVTCTFEDVENPDNVIRMVVPSSNTFAVGEHYYIRVVAEPAFKE